MRLGRAKDSCGNHGGRRGLPSGASRSCQYSAKGADLQVGPLASFSSICYGAKTVSVALAFTTHLPGLASWEASNVYVQGMESDRV